MLSSHIQRINICTAEREMCNYYSSTVTQQSLLLPKETHIQIKEPVAKTQLPVLVG